jgi:hypothetical protein
VREPAVFRRQVAESVGREERRRERAVPLDPYEDSERLGAGWRHG